MLFPRLNPHHLITFYFVAKEQSYTAAANMIFLTEPAVFKQIKALERAVGVKLVSMRKKKIHLTEAGHTLLVFAEEVYKQLMLAERFLSQTRMRSLRVGISIAISNIVSAAVVQFGHHFPDISLNVKDGSTDSIIKQLLDHEYDLAIVVSSNYKIPGFKAIRISDHEKLLCITKYSTEFSKIKSISLESLHDYKFIIPPQGSAIRKLIMDAFKIHGIELTNFMEFETNYYYYHDMLANIKKSAAFMPVDEVHEGIKKRLLQILPVKNEIIYTVDAIVNESTPDNSIIEEFIKLVKQVFDSRVKTQG